MQSYRKEFDFKKNSLRALGTLKTLKTLRTLSEAENQKFQASLNVRLATEFDANLKKNLKQIKKYNNFIKLAYNQN